MGEDDRQSRAGNRGCGFVLLAVVLFTIGATVLSSLGGDDSEDEGGPSDVAAIDVCRQAVEARLKAPSTAEFSDEVAVAETRHRYQVDGYVDAENSFGATLRYSYTCEAVWNSGDLWDTMNVAIDD